MPQNTTMLYLFQYIFWSFNADFSYKIVFRWTNSIMIAFVLLISIDNNKLKTKTEIWAMLIVQDRLYYVLVCKSVSSVCFAYFKCITSSIQVIKLLKCQKVKIYAQVTIISMNFF